MLVLAYIASQTPEADYAWDLPHGIVHSLIRGVPIISPLEFVQLL